MMLLSLALLALTPLIMLFAAPIAFGFVLPYNIVDFLLGGALPDAADIVSGLINGGFSLIQNAFISFLQGFLSGLGLL